MCGFFVTNKKISTYHSNLILDRLKYRGPDDFQIRSTKSGSYIFSRLEVTGRSIEFMQPLNSNNIKKKDFFFFNGEIYNYRNFIKNKKKTSDTLVLDKLFKKYGYLKSFKKLNGMFAISIIRKNFSNFILARDSFGQKPLYYWLNKKFWCVSSDPYCIAIIAKKNINYSELKLFLSSNENYGTRGLVNPQKSFFNDIKQVLPGEAIILKNNRIYSHNIKLDNIYPNRYKKTDIKVLYEKFNKLLEKTIEKYRDQNNDLALSFSGGIDSTLLLLNSLKSKEKNYYYIKVADKIDPIAQNSIKNLLSLGIKKYKVIRVKKKDYITRLIDFIKFSGSPARWGTAPSMMPLYEEMNKNNLKICIGGDGADELFYGYNNYADILNLKSIKKIDYNDLAKKFSFSGWEDKINNDYSNFIIKKINLFKKKNKNKLNHELACNFIKWLDLEIFFTSIAAPHSDLCSMRYSVELRSPFLDLDIINFIKKYLSNDNILPRKNILKPFLRGALQYKLKKLGLNTTNFIADNKEGTRNFAKQAVENLNLDKLDKNFLDLINFKEIKNITNKTKFKLFNIYIFYLIYEKKISTFEIEKKILNEK